MAIDRAGESGPAALGPEAKRRTPRDGFLEYVDASFLLFGAAGDLTGCVVRQAHTEGERPMSGLTIGLDIAKHVFQVHAVDASGQAVHRRKLKRSEVLGFFGQLEPSLIGIEACGTAHHWGRVLTALGHEVRLMAPHYVKPYVKRSKTDAADAEAICEAVSRPTMRFVPVKTTDQQAVLM